MKTCLVTLIVAAGILGYVPATSAGGGPESASAAEAGRNSQPKPPAPPSKARAPTRAEAPACAWLGHRAIMVLMRDDLIATEGFLRVYRRFDCPDDHLKVAFGCAIAAASREAREEIERWVNVCWRNPDASYSEFVKTLPPRKKEPANAGAKR